MSNVRLSVVIPVFGVEEYIAECLTSILSQPVERMEILVVNDCTRDSSALIAAEFARVDSRVRVINHDVNRGLGAARNTGLDAARGQYVTFPDSDDIVAPRAYSRMLQILDRSGSSFATGPAEEFGTRRKRYWTTDSTAFDTERVATSIGAHPELIEDHTAWNKIFRRSFLVDNDIRWPVGVKCEDVLPSARAYAAAVTVDVVSDVVYLYRRRRDSITTALGSEIAFADWVSQSRQALDAVSDAPTPARARLALKVLAREYLASIRLAAAVRATPDVQAELREMAALGSGFLRSSDLMRASAADRIRIALTAAGRFDELAKWADRLAKTRNDDIEAAMHAVPAALRRMFGFGQPHTIDDEVSAVDTKRSESQGDQPELSVVIPVHNVAEYLDELLRSIRASQGVALEVIVVDDWSTDRSREIAARHAAEDPRIRVVASVGRGGGQARNLGVELARGTYLAFADGDDIVPPHAYREMLAAARSSSAELVTAKHLRTYSTSIWDPTDRLYPLVGTVLGSSVHEYPSFIHPRTIWNRIFLREFWDRSVSSFCGVPRANDIVPFTSAVVRAKNVAFVPIVSYLYRARPGRGSMTAKLGHAPSVVSYFSEELTCAHVVASADDDAISRYYWRVVLAEDGWGNLEKYLAAQNQSGFTDGTVAPWIARLLSVAPAEAFWDLAPEHQAVWLLAARGHTATAHALTRAMRKRSAMGLEGGTAMIGLLRHSEMLSPKALDFLLWKFVIRRVIDHAPTLTMSDAAMAVESLKASGRIADFVAAPGTHEDSVIRAARDAAPERLLQLGRPTPPQESVRVEREGSVVHVSGKVASGAANYRWLFLRSRDTAGHVRRVPFAIVSHVTQTERWEAVFPSALIDVEGNYEVWCTYEDAFGVRTSNVGLRIEGHALQQGTSVRVEPDMVTAKKAIRRGDWTGAASILEARVTAGRESADELVLLARAYRKLRRYDDAERALEAASAMSPQDGALQSQARLAKFRAAFVKSPAGRIPLPKVLSDRFL